MEGILKKLSLDRPELRAWAMYDWANSAFVTTVMAAVLPIYYGNVAAATLPEHLRTAYWGYTAGIALLLVSLISPVLGTMSDMLGSKKRFLAAFVFLGASGSGLLYFVHRGDWLWASLFFTIGNIGFAAGNVFYEALLPHIAKRSEMDRVSAAGYAIGYLGGGVLLAVNVLMIEKFELFGFADKGVGVRWSFVSVAIWWAIFAIPIFLRVPEPPVSGAKRFSVALIRQSFADLLETFREVRQLREVFVFLMAYWLYMDGIGTIYKMATSYGREIGIGTGDLITAILAVQFLGIPFTFVFGWLGDKIGTKRGILLSLSGYVVICIFGYFMTTALHFWILAIAVAMVQGGSQALSRSFYARLIPKEQSAKFFSFYSVSSKFAGILGPLIFGITAQAMGGSRFSILFLIFFFIGGMIILSKVKEPAFEAA